MERLNIVPNVEDDLLLTEFVFSDLSYGMFQLQKIAEGVPLERFGKLSKEFYNLKMLKMQTDDRALMIDCYTTENKMLVKMFMRHPLDYECPACGDPQRPCTVPVEGYDGVTAFYGLTKVLHDLDLVMHTLYNPKARNFSPVELRDLTITTKETKITL